ncbi:hypothetical protein BH11PSE14_BH11PSE14_10910 [soil metagenome]
MTQRRSHAASWLALGACLCLAACGERPAVAVPGPAVPGEGPAPTVSAPIPAAGPTSQGTSAPTMSLTVDDPRIASLVGVRTPGLGIVSDGRAGFLVYGPYAHLDAGRYEVALLGSVQPGHAGPLHIDIARDRGATVVAAQDLEPEALANPGMGGALAVLAFELPVAADDLEVRVSVDAKSRIAVSGYDIRPRP